MRATAMISICITVKNRSRLVINGRELRLLPNCLEAIVGCVKPEDDAEIVISDWQSDDWPLAEWAAEAARPIPLKLVPIEGYFSRGRGLNVAFDHAQGDVLLFLDTDILICRELIDVGLQCVAAGKAFYPVYYQFTNPDHTSGKWFPSSYGNVMVAREHFLKAGRWPELKTWGREDNQLHDALRKIVPIVREVMPRMVHQWHPDSFAWKNRYANPQYGDTRGAR
ncbi:MAG: glycosyltransferase family 2 protein [Planctomycetes bacterium]|nr:glycosyltransferase family 2 protein [Planctomycetota bacterium]